MHRKKIEKVEAKGLRVEATTLDGQRYDRGMKFPTDRAAQIYADCVRENGRINLPGWLPVQ
ncbi:hypothetical protein [Thioalkalivibrio thiocyanodenitrificans]|uniref:hypothetical protein n=1 Tax=Thioalkalivibrio thiocyanodenitrificans TaxID=243063 RepID=UPI00036FB859|nr:hypothetical protein [Thioalkalivibrio thiocyanodenitrificans]